VATDDHARRVKKKPIKVGDTPLKPNMSDPWKVQADLQQNKQRIQELFHLPVNKDVAIREFNIAGSGTKAFLVYTEGMVDKNLINHAILEPLMLLSEMVSKKHSNVDICKKVLNSYLPSVQVTERLDFHAIVSDITLGNTVVFIDGHATGLSVETKGFQSRNVDTARVEQVIQGPQEGFVENLRHNISLIRKILHSENLITEFLSVGTKSKTQVAIMYMADITNLDLVNEVKRRLSSIKSDYISASGMIAEFIEDYPFSLMPQVLKTERPDRVTASLAEGKVAIVVDNNPFVLVVPGTFYHFLHTSEDYYIRFPYGFWMRFIRTGAIFLTLLLPGVYVAITTYHQEMLPTDLVLSIAAAKEAVPFPTIVEILMMELAFELIREAGIRVPGIVGPTLGIVGTLILGQAAVAASIVSPILIIVVAGTGLASYAIPNYEMAFGFRAMRFIFIFLSKVFGFLGISAGLYVLLCMVTHMRSFGVPYFAPTAPKTAPSHDLLLRFPMWQQEQRPDYLQTNEVQRQANISRGWKNNKNNKQKPE
jgi:spore germination protein KA